MWSCLCSGLLYTFVVLIAAKNKTFNSETCILCALGLLVLLTAIKILPSFAFSLKLENNIIMCENKSLDIMRKKEEPFLAPVHHMDSHKAFSWPTCFQFILMH